jgi:hypothetical protein
MFRWFLLERGLWEASVMAVEGAFATARARFDAVVSWLDGAASGSLTHAELEAGLAERGRELLASLLQDHLDVRAVRERRLGEVVDAEGVQRARVERGHTRALSTLFGEVTVTRLAYRAPFAGNLYPADAALNLPAEKHSHGLRRLAAVEASRGSFDAAVDAVVRFTGVGLGRRQLQELTLRAAADVDDFYDQRSAAEVADGDVLVLSADAKGVVMRPDGLRESTAKAAASRKLTTRLSKGEKRNRKRMAEVGAVYTITPEVRQPSDIITTPSDQHQAAPRRAPRPAARDKWLTVSVANDAADVIAAVFDEATRRDPDHKRTWVALVDGNNHQIDRIHAQAADRDVTVTIIIDFIHVLEYLWKAAWCFYPEADPAAETWVADQALSVLRGNASTVAAAIRRKATYQHLDDATRKPADTAAVYLLNKKPYLNYPTALANGWPIATGVIEGACRHLVKDRMDITGARWGVDGAEAVLKLRSLISNGDFDTYWTHHLAKEHQRVHTPRYLGELIPAA